MTAKSVSRVHRVPGGRQPSVQANRLGLWVRRQAAAVHITIAFCYYYSAWKLWHSFLFCSAVMSLFPAVTTQTRPTITGFDSVVKFYFYFSDVSSKTWSTFCVSSRWNRIECTHNCRRLSVCYIMEAVQSGPSTDHAYTVVLRGKQIDISHSLGRYILDRAR